MKTLLKSGCLLLVLWLVSSGVRASCQFVNGVTAEIPGYISFGNVSVQRDAPVGSVIATATTGAYNGGNTIAGCTEAWTFRQELTKWLTLSTQGNGVYNTNVPGVGIRMTSPSGKVLPYDLPINANTYANINGNGIKAELIKTGDITGGTLDTGMLARASVVNQFYIANVTLNGTNTVSSVACSVSTPHVDVPLGQHGKTEFTGVGSTTAWTSFDIGLDCSTGARINVRFEPAAGVVSGMTDVMNLDGGGRDGNASGIGVQLWFRPDGGSAVKFGQETYYWTSAYGGPETVQLQARYYQTARTITSGAANATATFTLTYR
ncbi:TPA: fimbrial protein [Klebsiella quasipneumoniae subsp. quasipneumoniae]|nr:fimbrial protein [Klebsiella quasipneumoniae subsp. similipneumoniae]HBR1458093.1 fimbrial protein [Klebsiella quasipneumoniae subsp. quasipneumoniae]HBR2036003.1 fimbrial protein [Klebsiella quasipneumoniae subsp. quasipneumoniae]HCI6432705.1 fimbrial protein [Klebsiella quasipneumoniae subsp. similipneumoniae]